VSSQKRARIVVRLVARGRAVFAVSRVATAGALVVRVSSQKQARLPCEWSSIQLWENPRGFDGRRLVGRMRAELCAGSALTALSRRFNGVIWMSFSLDEIESGQMRVAARAP